MLKLKSNFVAAQDAAGRVADNRGSNFATPIDNDQPQVQRRTAISRYDLHRALQP